MSDILHIARSVRGHLIRVTGRQWAHVTEAHDYMAGNIDKVLETLSEPTVVVQGQEGESLALRDYERTNITHKTAVVVYRDEPDGFLITAFFTSKPEAIVKKGQIEWPPSRDN